jgi:hypothetical protein
MAKSKIHRPAHIEMCESCGLHGCIVFSNGTRSQEIAAQADTLPEIKEALAQKLLLHEEIPALIAEIKEKIPLDNIHELIEAIARLIVSVAEEDLEKTPQQDILSVPVSSAHLN